MRIALLGVWVALTVFSVPGSTKDKRIHGYVTNVVSPGVFEIEDYRIRGDLSLVLEFEQENDEKVDFRMDDIRIGTELEVRGEVDEKTGEMKAKSLKVYLDEHKRVKRTALLLSQPAIARTSDGQWRGTFSADGQRVLVEPTTKVLFKPNKTEQQALKDRRKQDRKGASDKEGNDQEDLRPLESIDEIGPNTFMNYEGIRQRDGTIAATRVEFIRNELEKGEGRMWKQLTPKTKEPDYFKGKPGELSIAKVGKFKLTPNQEVQQYVGKIGESLSPGYQRSLAPGDPNKIPFQFYAVDSKLPNAFALPNGTIVFFSPMFDVLENEAQLAAVLGHEIAHSVQEHTRRQMEYHKKKRFAMGLAAAFASGMGYYAISDVLNLIQAAIHNGYSRSLENQADRIGLEYMIAANYDPREAPAVWKSMARKLGDRPTDFFWSSHENNTTRRSYLMAELRNNYPDLKPDRFNRNEDEYRRIAALARGGKVDKKRLKVKY